MRKILLVGIKDVKIRARDIPSFIILIVMPLILILVLGLTFQPLWTEKPFTIDISIFNEDKGEISKILIDDVFKGEKLKDMININFSDSEEEIKDMVNKGKIAAGIVIKKNFSINVKNMKETGIKIYADPEQTIKAGVIKSIVESFILEVLKRRAILSTSMNFLRERGLISKDEIERLIPEWLKEIEKIENPILIKEELVGGKNKNPLAIEYYAVGMGIMYLLFATNSGAQTIFEEKRTKTLDRIKTMPVKEGEIILGKIFGIFLLALLQFTIIILFTRIFYGVNWGSSIPSLILMVISSVLCFSGFSTFLASILKSDRLLGSLGPALSMILAFLGGGMWPIYLFPDWLNTLSRLTPHRWALDGFFKLMYENGGIYAILPNIGVLLSLSVVFFLIGTFILKKRGI